MLLPLAEAPHRPPYWYMRIGASLFALAMLGLFALLYHFAPGRYFQALFWLGDVPYRYPFLDSEAVLDAIGCARRGVNVYAANACMSGGFYNYSPLLLHFTWLGPQQRDGVGVALLLGYCAALALLPPPENARALALRCVAAVSPATLFAAERGNLDLGIVCLVTLGVFLSLRGPLARTTGYGVLGLAAALKYYPAAAFILFLRERRGVLVAVLLASCLLIAWYLAAFGRGTLVSLGNLPGGPPFGYWFGASNLTYGLALLHGAPVPNLNPDISQYRAVLLHDNVWLQANKGTFGLELLALAAALWLSRRPARPGLDAERAVWLVAGAALICVCFFEAQNVVYRGMFLLFVLPAGGWRCLPVLFLLWEEALRRYVGIAAADFLGPSPALTVQIGFWLLRELVWWLVVVDLGACAMRFMLEQARRL